MLNLLNLLKETFIILVLYIEWSIFIQVFFQTIQFIISTQFNFLKEILFQAIQFSQKFVTHS